MDYDKPESIMDSEYAESRDAREQDLGGEPGIWTPQAGWIDKPSRREIEADEKASGVQY